jgi:hypothetical protein
MERPSVVDSKTGLADIRIFYPFHLS